ncbi:MAG: acetate--CoA ligase family protein [Acidobacteria bacterium]|nr:acetate--CoA ligase family protein [Acidobacteriota bacterium]
MVSAGLERAASHALLARAESEGRAVLLEHEVYALLEGAGIRVPAHRFVASPEEVDETLCAGLPSDRLVVKVVSPDVGVRGDRTGSTGRGVLAYSMTRMLRRSLISSRTSGHTVTLTSPRCAFSRRDITVRDCPILLLSGTQAVGALPYPRPKRMTLGWTSRAKSA